MICLFLVLINIIIVVLFLDWVCYWYRPHTWCVRVRETDHRLTNTGKLCSPIEVDYNQGRGEGGERERQSIELRIILELRLKYHSLIYKSTLYNLHASFPPSSPPSPFTPPLSPSSSPFPPPLPHVETVGPPALPDGENERLWGTGAASKARLQDQTQAYPLLLQRLSCGVQEETPWIYLQGHILPSQHITCQVWNTLYVFNLLSPSLYSTNSPPPSLPSTPPPPEADALGHMPPPFVYMYSRTPSTAKLARYVHC